MVIFERTYTENEHNSFYLNLTDDDKSSYGSHFPPPKTPLLIIGNSGIGYKASMRGNNQIWGSFRNFILGERITPNDKMKISYNGQVQDGRHIVEITIEYALELTGEEVIEEVLEGSVYALTNPAWENWVKFGHTSDLDSRKSSYNTGSPLKDYDYIRDEEFTDRKSAERIILRLADHFSIKKGHGEWYLFNDESEAEKLLDALVSIAN